MKKLLVLAMIAGFFTGCNKEVAPSMPKKEETNHPKKTQVLVSAIHEAAKKNEWERYTPSANYAKETLYFKKRVKNRQYYTYRYQNGPGERDATLYAKVHYGKDHVNVEFADKVSMNLGRVGIDNKMDKNLEEFKDAIELEISARA